VERKDYAFDRIEAASNHLLGVINDVLDMSKIEAGMIQLSEEIFDIHGVMDNVMAVNQYRIEEKSQEFTLHIDSNIPKLIVADNHRLAQVITNLLSNACKFTDEGGELRLDACLETKSDTNCTLRFDVTDNGIGLTSEQQGKLFKSFVQAEESTTRKFGGTGLGLAISKHIVELMGGKIWVKSESGKGSTFSFTINAGLPQIEELHKLANAENNETSKLSYPGLTVLIAEDVDRNREIISAVLEDCELEVVCAENGGEAVKIFEKEPEKFSLIFMDVHMPEMDGFQATAKIRELPHPHAEKVPIVAMTANVFREDIERCLEAGMNAHIGKPLDFEAVRKVLVKYL
jgi:CheY-like chemotaxis protein/two-component sensor histidine kinase